MLKEWLIRKIIAKNGVVENLKILDLGSGRSKNLINILKENPNITYVGVEPSKVDADYAKEELKLFKNVKIINSLAYDLSFDEKFDICFSLSALEHIKDLKKFLKTSLDHVKKGGLVVHMYDLGHALYPSCLKEKLQIFLGNNFPCILPENKYVSYVDERKVCDWLKELGANVFEVTYHQLPNGRSFIKKFKAENNEEREVVEKLLSWELDSSKHFKKLSTKDREKLFPSICVWAKKD